MNNLFNSNDDEIIDFINEILNNDEKYIDFLENFKKYKKYAGYSNEIEKRVILLLETLQRYSVDINIIEKKMLIRMFKWVLNSLDNITETSIMRRNLVDDFLKC